MSSDASTTTANAEHEAPGHGQRSTQLPGWLTALVALGALGVLSLAYAALISPTTMLPAGVHMSEAATVWARYAAAYSGALGVALLALLAAKARNMLAGVLIQASVAQVLLGVVGVVDHRWEQVPADAILVVVFGICARRLVRAASR